MKFERIDDNKIKVTFSDQDLSEWNIDFENLSYNTPKVQELFFTMMQRAEQEMDFVVDDSQLVIEAVPTSQNGFIMFITKVEAEDLTTVSKYLKSKFKYSNLKLKKKPIHSSKTLIYYFDSFDDVCETAKLLNPVFNSDNSLYKFENGYYIVLNYIYDFNISRSEAILLEYGIKVSNGKIFLGILLERGEELIKNNAINCLSQYF